MNFLKLLDVFLIFCVTAVVNRYNILYTSYSSIFTIFYTTFWETSIKRSKNQALWYIIITKDYQVECLDNLLTWINGKALIIDKWQNGKPNEYDFYVPMAKEWPIWNELIL